MFRGRAGDNLDDNLGDQHTLDASNLELADGRRDSEGVSAETGALATERAACGRRSGRLAGRRVCLRVAPALR